jgi:thiol-disulfide isomerase/thioredoxin
MRTLPAILFLAVLPAWAQPCEVSGPAKTALDALPAAPGANAGERLAAARKLRDQFPQDYFVHRAYQDVTWSRGVSSPDIQAEYRALKNAHPDDPLFATLYARAMTGTKTPEAISVLNAVLEKHPDYAYAHQKLTEIYSSTAFRDLPKFQAHMLAYRKACPTQLAAWTDVGRADDPEFLKETAAGLRKLLDGRTGPPAIATYPTLWTTEFKAEPLTQHQQVRERIRRDVARLRAMDPAKYPTLWNTLSQGYKLLDDAEGAKWVEENRPKSAPAPEQSAGEAIRKWQTENRQKPGEDYQDYQARLAQRADEWIRQWPDNPYPIEEKFNALRFAPDTPLEELVQLAEQWLRVYEAHPGGPSPYLAVAQFYASKNMRYDQLPGLLEKALKDLREPVPPSLSDLNARAGSPRLSSYTSQWSTWSSAADIYVKIKQYDKAREILSKLGPSVVAGKPPESAGDSETRLYKHQLYLYWNTMAKVAHAEGRKLDELVYQRKADAATPFDQPEATLQRRTEQQRAIWKNLGGTDEGFDAFLNLAGANPKPATPAPARAARPAVVNTASQWTTLDKPLPDFRFSDAGGKTWTLADLKGKVTLVNLWATWCGPCKAELPYLQKLFDKVRQRTDLQVLTLNTDDNPGLILPFLHQTKYTFPVLPALGYVNQLVPELSIPRNWIVDADGILRQERVGFGSGEDKWVDDMIAFMEKARK